MALYAYGSRAAQAVHWLHRYGVLAIGPNDLDMAVSGGIDRRYSLAEKVGLATALSDLFEFEANELQDVERIRAAYAQWMRQHLDLVDDTSDPPLRSNRNNGPIAVL